MRILASLLTAASLALAVPAFAGGPCGPACGGVPCCGQPSCCAACGCHKPCRQVCCQIICDYEEVEIKCWDVKCEDYCLPIPVLGSCLNKCGKSCDPCCESGCDVGCGSGSCDDGCCCGGKCEPAVTCGIPRVKKKLMLRTVKVKKPVYKCVTKYLCDGCEADAEAVAPEQSAPAAAPAPAAKPAPLPPAPKQAVLPIVPRF